MKLTKKNILIIGFGIVGIPCSFAIKKLNPKKLYIIDMKKQSELNEKIPTGAIFLNFEIKEDNYKDIFDSLKLDIIIDLSVYVNTFDMLRYCAEKNIHFISTSIEPWQNGQTSKEMNSKTSIANDMIELEKLKLELVENGHSVTQIVNSGANPGCVSHFIKHLLDTFNKSKKSYSEKAQILGIQTIHIAEIDTQVENKKNDKSFRNTWSIDGFYEEASAQSEIALGSHELKIPKNTKIVDINENCKIAILPEKGYKVKVRSYLPDYDIEGKVIQHAEIGSICKFLSDENYSPSVYYAYQYSKPLEDSIKKFGIEGGADLKLENKPLDADNSTGIDFLGVLAICGNLDMYFCGSKVSTEQAKLLDLPHISPTNAQVLGGILSSLQLCLKNPNYGLLCSCDEIPKEDFNFIWKHAKPYLGDIVIQKMDKKALSTQFYELILT